MSDVLISREHLQELIDCANVPDVDSVYQVEVCVECGWRDEVMGARVFVANVEKHKVGCPKQTAIKAAMKVLES